MQECMDRRGFLTVASIGLAASRAGSGAENKAVRLGVIGTGHRGTNLLQVALSIGAVEVPALCDIRKENLAKAQDVVETAGLKKPEGYLGEEEYKRLLSRDDLDAVLIATPWEWHTPMAVYSMKTGKYTGVEVPAAITLEQCWELVNTQEQTRTPCMMMENWSFRRDNLAVLNMIRAGVFGEINHCHCAHSHNCTDTWWFKQNGEPDWEGEYLLKRNADQYPTHSLGPVISWMDLNCRDYPAYVTSTATRSLSLPYHFAKKFGPHHPAAKRKYKQSDIITSVVKTIRGNTIVINNDMQSPRPYDNRWEISGTNGLYNEQRNAVYIEGVSPPYPHAIRRGSPYHEEWESFAKYQVKYDHSWYKALSAGAEKNALDADIGHGRPDYLEMKLFLEAARKKAPTPLDIYDSVLMCSIIPLSERSIASGSMPIQFPDFTRGKWKTKQPYFALQT